MSVERNSIKVSIDAGNKLSDYEAASRRQKVSLQVYMFQVVNYINENIQDEIVREKVLNYFKKIPHGALARKFSKFNEVVTMFEEEIRIAKEKEQGIVPKKAKKLEVEIDDLMDLQSDLIDDWKNEEEKIEPKDSDTLTN